MGGVGPVVAVIAAATGVYAGFAADVPGGASQSRGRWALLAAVAAGILAHQGAVAGRDALRTKRPAPRQAQRNRGLMLTRVRT
ncbi:MAG: hypothetical protein ACRDYA_24230 [Egibacteraceae bacterium]